MGLPSSGFVDGEHLKLEHFIVLLRMARMKYLLKNKVFSSVVRNEACTMHVIRSSGFWPNNWVNSYLVLKAWMEETQLRPYHFCIVRTAAQWNPSFVDLRRLESVLRTLRSALVYLFISRTSLSSCIVSSKEVLLMRSCHLRLCDIGSKGDLEIQARIMEVSGEGGGGRGEGEREKARGRRMQELSSFL